MKTIWKQCSLILLTVITLTSCSKDSDNTAAPAPTSNAKTLSDTERQIPLTGQPNFRDLGGYTNADGKIVKTATIYRSGDLSALTTDDLTKVNALGIKRIADLRTSSEVTSKPDKEISNTVVYNLSLLDDGAVTDPNFMTKILNGTMTGEQFMIPLYAIDNTKIKNWKVFFDALQDGGTTLYHCTAGKDRAGMTSALILSALDVPRETIIKDFMLSNQFMATVINQQAAQIDQYYGAGAGDKMRPVFGVEQQYIEAFFTDIETKYGSVDNFLTILEVDKSKMKSLYLSK